MIRLVLIYAAFTTVSVIALSRWYLALAALVVLTAVAPHPDMPRQILGIQGLNPWNATFLMILLSRALQEPPSGTAEPSPPSPLKFFFTSYVLLILVSGAVATLDVKSVKGAEYVSKYNVTGMFVDTIINPLKYVVVGVLVYSGTVDRQRARLVLFAAVGSGIFYAFLLFHSLKLRVFTIDFHEARRLGEQGVGVFANNLAQILGFTMIASVILTPLLTRAWQRFFWLSAATIQVPCYIAMKSRGGFLSFCAAWLMLGVLRWRILLFLLPAAALLVIWLEPSVRDRVLTGMNEEEPYQQSEVDWDQVSAGRITGIWPPTIEEIKKSPLIGHGRFGILRTAAYGKILESEGKVPSHPHNAYLEALLDSGVVGLSICLGFLALIGIASFSLMTERSDLLVCTAGTLGLVAVVIISTASLSGYSFFPTETTVPYITVWAVVLRLLRDRRMPPQPGAPPSSQPLPSPLAA